MVKVVPYCLWSIVSVDEHPESRAYALEQGQALYCRSCWRRNAAFCTSRKRHTWRGCCGRWGSVVVSMWWRRRCPGGRDESGCARVRCRQYLLAVRIVGSMRGCVDAWMRGRSPQCPVCPCARVQTAVV